MGEHEDPPYFSMKLIEGGSLNNFHGPAQEAATACVACAMRAMVDMTIRLPMTFDRKYPRRSDIGARGQGRRGRSSHVVVFLGKSVRLRQTPRLWKILRLEKEVGSFRLLLLSRTLFFALKTQEVSSAPGSAVYGSDRRLDHSGVGMQYDIHKRSVGRGSPQHLAIDVRPLSLRRDGICRKSLRRHPES